jgi:hypothetical protein
MIVTQAMVWPQSPFCATASTEPLLADFIESVLAQPRPAGGSVGELQGETGRREQLPWAASGRWRARP